MRVIDISRSKHINFSFKSTKDFKEEEHKGWSFSNVYSFEEMRDIYLLLLNQNNICSVEKFSRNEVIPKVKPCGKEWTSRRVREILNAMVNFRWFTRDVNGTVYQIATLSPLFSQDSFGEDLNEEDYNIFKKTFLTYERFREYLALYAQNDFVNINESSSPVFSFSSGKKYTNTFFKSLSDNVDLLCVDTNNTEGEKNSTFLTFWDVFISWALRLNMMEKFNSLMFDVKLSTGKSFACSYFISSSSKILPDIFTILNESFAGKKTIDVNDLILHICLKYRKPVEDVKKYIIAQYIINKKYMSPIRTSEIFVNRSEKRDDSFVSFPKYKDSYISHLMLQ